VPVIALLSACGAIPPGPSYEPPSGDNLAIVRPVWATDLDGYGANVRIREINGRGVSMVFPEDVRLSGGTTRMGLLAWSGPGPSQVAICVVFEAIPGYKYKIAAAGFRRDWAISLTRQADSGELPVTPQLVRHQPFNADVLPCEGVKG